MPNITKNKEIIFENKVDDDDYYDGEKRTFYTIHSCAEYTNLRDLVPNELGSFLFYRDP